MESISYHNTTSQDSDFVVKSRIKNKTQEEIVFEIFKRFKKLSASEVLEEFPKNVPLTSIRRAMSNLQYENKLRKLSEKREGLYGAPEHYYAVVKPEDKQYEMFN